MSAPITSPLPYTCPNCSFGSSERTPLCPSCGAHQTASTGGKLDTETLVAYSLCIVSSGSLGAFLFFYGFVGDKGSLENGLCVFGAVFIAIALFFGWKLVREI